MYALTEGRDAGTDTDAGNGEMTATDTSIPASPSSGTTGGADGNQTEPDEDTPDEETPGFGVGTAPVGLGTGAYMFHRRMEEKDD